VDLIRATETQPGTVWPCLILFQNALEAFDFLPAAETRAALEALNLSPDVLAPFTQWIDADLSLNAWVEVGENYTPCGLCGYAFSAPEHRERCFEISRGEDFPDLDERPNWVRDHCDEEFEHDSMHDPEFCCGD
jgi:hypothetical protein